MSVNNYEFNRTTKETCGQIKKHYTQFNSQELSALKYRMSSININNIKLSKHATNHITIDYKSIKKLFSDYKIIEFNLTSKYDKLHPRVLIRSNQTIDIIVDNKLIKANICAVYDLITNQVITIYMNDKNDCHETLNKFRYENDNITIDVCNYV